MVCCGVREIIRRADEMYAEQPGVINKDKCWPSKSVKIYNNSKYFIELDVSDKRTTFLRGMSFGAMNANADLEFESGDHSETQTVRVMPGMVKKIRVGTWAYKVTAYMNGRLLFQNRVYSTRQCPCFFDRHYGEAAVGRVREVPRELLVEEHAREPTKPRRWFFF